MRSLAMAAAHRPGAQDADVLDLAQGGVAGQVGHLGGLALGEEVVALRLRLPPGHEALEDVALLIERFLEGEVERRLDQVHVLGGGVEVARLAGDLLAEAVEDGAIGTGLVDLLLAVADLVERRAVGDELLSEGDRAVDEVTLDDGVDQAGSQRLLRADGVADGAHLQRLGDAGHARQSLRAARARHEAQLDLRLPVLRGRRADAVMRAHRDLQAAAQGGAVDGRHDRLGAILHRGLGLGEAGGLGRLAELGDVGPGDEGAAAAGQHDALDRVVVGDLLEGLEQAQPHAVTQRVDGRVVDQDQGDVAALLQRDHVGDCDHCRAPQEKIIKRRLVWFRRAAGEDRASLG